MADDVWRYSVKMLPEGISLDAPDDLWRGVCSHSAHGRPWLCGPLPGAGVAGALLEHWEAEHR